MPALNATRPLLSRLRPWLILALAVVPAVWHVVDFEQDADGEYPTVERPTFNRRPPAAYRLAEPGDTIDRMAIYLSAGGVVLAAAGGWLSRGRAGLWPAALALALAALWHAATPGPGFDGWHGLGWRRPVRPPCAPRPAPRAGGGRGRSGGARCRLGRVRAGPIPRGPRAGTGPRGHRAAGRGGGPGRAAAGRAAGRRAGRILAAVGLLLGAARVRPGARPGDAPGRDEIPGRPPPGSRRGGRGGVAGDGRRGDLADVAAPAPGAAPPGRARRDLHLGDAHGAGPPDRARPAPLPDDPQPVPRGHGAEERPPARRAPVRPRARHPLRRGGGQRRLRGLVPRPRRSTWRATRPTGRCWSTATAAWTARRPGWGSTASSSRDGRWTRSCGRSSGTAATGRRRR